MIGEFETRLADVLGTRLPAPLAGAVDVAPGRPDARIVLSVASALPIDGELLSRRLERVPGDADPRRVLKLRCGVGLDVRLLPGASRSDQLRALDQTLFALGDAAFNDGSALLPADDSDPGFLIQRMQLAHSEPPAAIALDAEGFFWPVGQAGVSGTAIRALRIREAVLPLRLSPERPNLVAGAGAVELTISFGATGTLQLEEQGPIASLAFGAVVVSVSDAGGRPGAGTLSGGAVGPAGARVVPVQDGRASVQYTPPAQPVAENLIVRLEDHDGGAGLELGRFRLVVRGS